MSTIEVKDVEMKDANSSRKEKNTKTKKNKKNEDNNEENVTFDIKKWHSVALWAWG